MCLAPNIAALRQACPNGGTGPGQSTETGVVWPVRICLSFDELFMFLVNRRQSSIDLFTWHQQQRRRTEKTNIIYNIIIDTSSLNT